MENITKSDYLLIIDGSSLLSTQFFGNLPREIVFAKTLEEKEKYFSRIMQTSKGIYTNAVYGFMRVLLKILKEQNPTHLAVAWDVGRDTFRREIYPDYKGNRSETIEPLKQQFILCQEVLKAMNVPQFMDSRYEADDFSGTLAAKFEEQLPVRIMTKDNDYLQLISDKTYIWMIHSTSKKTEELYQKYNLNQKKLNVPDRTFPFDEELLKSEFMVGAKSITSLKALQGDASDNIKGVKGVGEATAQVLIAHYGSIEKLYSEIRGLDDAGRKKMSEFWKTELSLKRSPISHLLKESETELVGEKAAILSKELATIKTDIDLNGLTLDELKLNLNKTEAEKEFSRLEFKSLKFHEDVWQEAADNPFEGNDYIYGGNPFEGEPSFEENLSFEESLPFEKSLLTEGSSTLNEDNPFSGSSHLKADEIRVNRISQSGQQENAINIHSMNKYSINKLEDLKYTLISSQKELIAAINEIINEHKTKNIGLFSHFAFSFYVECDTIYGVGLTISHSQIFYISFLKDITEKVFAEQLKLLIENKISLTCYQLKKVLTYLGNDFKDYDAAHKFFDVELAAYLLNPLRGNYPLGEIFEDYLKDKFRHKDECLNGIPAATAVLMYPDITAYETAYESAVIYYLREKLSDELELKGMYSLFYNIEMPLVFTLYDMECQGIKADREKLHEYSIMLNEGIIKLEKGIHELAGESFNINSPKQLGVILFEKLQLPSGKKTKTGYSTSADVLEKIVDKHPVIALILEYRQLSKLKSTYADGLSEYISGDGRIHSTFNQTVTATGRLSSTEPNLQNIPIRLELGRQIRKVFTPEEGYVFIDADYSQIELRILAHMSGDEKLINAYNEASDIHKITASQVFHVPIDEVTSEQRSNAKAVNFGIVYGISSFGLGQGLNITRHEAEDYITKYFETYERVKEFLDELILNGREKGYVSTIYNRIRPVEGLNDKSYQVRSSEERIAMNSPIQGTAADIIKIAMNNVNQRLRKEKLKSRLLLQVHDELLIEALIEEKEIVKKIMREEMQQAADLKVPLEVDIKEGSSWYEAK